MTAEAIYPILNQLSDEERFKILNKLKKDLSAVVLPKKKKINQNQLTVEIAMQQLLISHFNIKQ